MDKLFFYDTELGRLGIRDNSQNITNLYFESILDSANSVFLISEFSCVVENKKGEKSVSKNSTSDY